MNSNLPSWISSGFRIFSNADLAAEIILLATVLLYTLFAILVYKQVGILNKTIITSKGVLINGLALLHLVASVVILILILVTITS
ncbi:MAG: hypothetical protein Q8O75_00200 [bacterium]|nr:hypothetical protein [bacterium]